MTHRDRLRRPPLLSGRLGIASLAACAGDDGHTERGDLSPL